MRYFLPGFRFIRLLSQDPESERFFQQHGFRTRALSNGIDTDHFRPVEPVPIPAELEKAFECGRKVLIHIGHLKLKRGMDVLAGLAEANRDWLIVMIGSKRFPGDPETVRLLKEAGCVILQDFIENLPALYCRADAYIFPVTHPYGAIDMPLTVLEAMACNRPILTSPYKALPRFVPEGNGVYYFRSIEGASHQLARISANETPVDTRTIALQYSWEVILAQLNDLYLESLNR